MSGKTVWSVYFSGTGTTERTVKLVAQTAAELLNRRQRTLCFNLPEAREKEVSFEAGDLAVVGVPVYAGRVPNLLLPYLKEKLKGCGAAAVPVVLYGNRNFDDALSELCGVLEENGFHTIAAGAFVGEHAFSDVLGAGRPDGEDLALAEELGRRASQIVAEAAEKGASDSGPDSGLPSPVCVPGHFPPGPYYTPRDRHGAPINILKVKPKLDPERCGNCGLCALLCPLGAIDSADVSKITGVCMKCGACVKKCPAGARYFDDPGYLYHKKELEEMYARRAESRIFY